MTWTREAPKTPGYYWWRLSKGRKATVLYISSEHIQKQDVFTEGALVMFIDEVPGEWSSTPLDLPKERT